MGRDGRWSSGKASRAVKQKKAALKAAAMQESELHGGFGAGDADEPQFAQPARKRARGEEQPTRRSRRSEKRKPPLRGPPAVKPQRTPIGELPAEAAEQRRKKQREYDKTARDKKRKAASPEVELKLDDVPYSRTHSGKERKGGKNAREAAKARDKAALIATLDSFGDEAQQAQVLRDVSESKEKRGVAVGAGYHPSEEVQVAVFEKRQRQKQVARASATAKPRGRASDDQRSFIEANDVAGAPSPHQDPAEVPSLAARARHDGRPIRSAKRALQAAAGKRAKLTEREEGISWSQVKARRGHSKITAAIRAELHEWVLNHPRVVNSPIGNDTLLVDNRETGKKERVGKLLLEISIRELHNDLIELPVDKGGAGGGLPSARDARTDRIIISDTALRYLLPPQLVGMTEKHKQMCGCEVCLIADSHQKSLNARRVRLKRELLSEARAMEQGPERDKVWDRALKYQPTLNHATPVPWHLKPGLALGEIQCGCVTGTAFPHWNCVLRRCQKCPSYPAVVVWEGAGGGVAGLWRGVRGESELEQPNARYSRVRGGRDEGSAHGCAHRNSGRCL